MAHRGVSVKTLKRMLKKKGLKTTGRKAALTRRAKKAHLLKGGVKCVRAGDQGGTIHEMSSCNPPYYPQYPQ